MKASYGVMLIGCGYIGEQHLADIHYRPDIRVEAVADRNRERAALMAAKYHVAAWGTDYRRFLREERVDIVIIATNTDSHVSLLADCVAAGKHVLCEKPLASTLEQGRRFYELASSGGSRVLVGHILRHNASYQKIISLIREGAIGRLKLMRMVQNHHVLQRERYDRLLRDCSPIADCGVHYFDVMQWAAESPIVEVRGLGARLDDYDAVNNNYGMVHIRHENGCVGYYEGGWSANLAFGNTKEFVGDAGHIALTLQADRQCHREEGDLISLYNSGTRQYTEINVPAVYKNMYGQLKALIGMMETGGAATPSLEEAFDAFAVSMAAEESMKTGYPVQLRERRYATDAYGNQRAI